MIKSLASGKTASLESGRKREELKKEKTREEKKRRGTKDSVKRRRNRCDSSPGGGFIYVTGLVTDRIDFRGIVGWFLKDGAWSSHCSVPHECSTKKYRSQFTTYMCALMTICAVRRNQQWNNMGRYPRLELRGFRKRLTIIPPLYSKMDRSLLL